MFSFFKNIFNFIIGAFLVIILIVVLGRVFFHFEPSNILNFDKEKVEEQVGDFSKVDTEFNIDNAVNVGGYKTVVAKHASSGQKMIIVDSGKKTLLTTNDITNDRVKEKLEELCKKFKYHSTTVDNIEITDRGYLTTYGKRVPYVKFNAKISNFPGYNISGIISADNSDKDNQRLIISVNDKKHYSQLITSEFYKNVKETSK